MKSLFRSYDTSIDNAYIVTIKGNSLSEKYSARCQDSCRRVSQQFKVWDAFDGTGDGSIIVPDHSKACSYMSIIKIMDNYLTKAEVAIALSHISLWLHCAKIDKPIIILEHDAIMLRKLDQFKGYNTIMYLGCVEWVKEKWPLYPIPVHGSDGPNKHFICRAHAYAIDPAVAKNLLAQTLKMGIYASLDEMMYADLYNISHDGIYAYDEAGVSTAQNRPKEGRTTVKNDDLSR